ncbi:hypothetical protein Tco_0566888 [Tanacetum coccineum]
MIDIGTPCRETISLMYNLVRVSILSVSQVGMKCADLVRRSTMTQIVSCPFDVKGSFVKKSIVILSHFHIGISGCTISIPSGRTFIVPAGRALSPKLLTWYLPLVQNLGKDEGTSFAFDLHAPRFFDEVAICRTWISFSGITSGASAMNFYNSKRENVYELYSTVWGVKNLGKDEGTSFAFDLHAPSKRFISRAFLQLRDVKRTINSNQLFWEFKAIDNVSYFGNDIKRSNITRVQLSPFAKTYHSFPRRYFQNDLVSYLKLKRFSSYVGIALLTITSGLDTVLDLNYFLGCLVNDLWASELTIPNFSPTDR